MLYNLGKSIQYVLIIIIIIIVYSPTMWSA